MRGLTLITQSSVGVYVRTLADILDSGFDRSMRIEQYVEEGDERHKAELDAVSALVEYAHRYGCSLPVVWMRRESARMADGTYRSVPVGLPFNFPPEHFVHLPQKSTDTDSIAYTESADKGHYDRQTVVKIGKYLKKYNPDLTDAEIQEHVMQWRCALNAGNAELKLATDIETINRIFETELCAKGGRSVSCMQGDFADRTVRPYHVYADSPDVAIAYLACGNAIVARSVVSTKDKRIVRAYALAGRQDLCTKLVNELKAIGYTYGSLKGSRLTAREYNGDVTAPYIDGDCYTFDYSGGAYFTVCPRGDYEARNADGTAEHEGERCSDCEDRLVRGEGYNGRCESCANEYSCCEDCEEEYRSDEGYCVGRREEKCVCDYCCRNNYTRVGDLYLPNDEVVEACDETKYDKEDDTLRWYEDEAHTEDCGCIVQDCDGEYHYTEDTKHNELTQDENDNWHVAECRCIYEGKGKHEHENQLELAV